jgi:exopolysaccharide biosynthesis polyprenyl glycosylphosphotransferase
MEGKQGSVERMTVTSADTGGGLALPVDVLAQPVETTRSLGRERYAHLRRQLLGADMLAGALAGVAAGGLATMSAGSVFALTVALAVAWPVLAYLCGLYASEDLRTWASGIGESPKLVLACLGLSWPLVAFMKLLGAGSPLAGALVASGVTAATAGLTRASVRMKLHRRPELRQRTLIVGSGEVANRLVRRLRQHAELGLQPIGFIDDHVHGEAPSGLPRLGALDALAPLLQARRADRVMIAFSSASHEELLQCIRTARDAGVAVDVVPRLFEFLDGARTIEQVGGMPLLSIRVPSFTRLARFSKRTLDIVGASLALAALSPLLALIAVAIKLDSRGPVVFVQRRAGRGGRFFDLYKFRTMRPDAEVLVRSDGAIEKVPDDDRITRVGRLLRRLSCDELPQLFNVLRGDMSLVGPRPLVVAEARALNEQWQVRRADLRPGLTGPWQISGRSHIPFFEMIALDYQYVAGWSLARDIEILLATIPVVFSGRGAY